MPNKCERQRRLCYLIFKHSAMSLSALGGLHSSKLNQTRQTFLWFLFITSLHNGQGNVGTVVNCYFYGLLLTLMRGHLLVWIPRHPVVIAAVAMIKTYIDSHDIISGRPNRWIYYLVTFAVPFYLEFTLMWLARNQFDLMSQQLICVCVCVPLIKYCRYQGIQWGP